MEYCNKIIVAPMAGVTDLAFRLICKEFGADLVVSEMISAKGIEYKDKKTNRLLETEEKESPLIVQLFGNDPDILARSAFTLQTRGVKAIDLNMGCPTPKITQNGDGAALAKDVEKARAAIGAMVRECSIPLSVKFRSGWDEKSKNCVALAKMAEEEGAAAVTIHGRTREQFYAGEVNRADILAVRKAVSIPVIANGDIKTPEDAVSMMKETDCNSVMIGRGCQGNPFLFRQIKEYLTLGTYTPVTLEEKKETILKHLSLLIQYKGEYVGVMEFRKHMAWYIKGMPHSATIKNKAFTAETKEEMLAVIGTIF